MMGLKKKSMNDIPFWKCTGSGCQIETLSATQELLEVAVNSSDRDIVSDLYFTSSPEVLVDGLFSARFEIEDYAGDFYLEKLHFGIVDIHDKFHYMTVKHDWFPGSLMLNFFPNSLDYSVFKKFRDMDMQLNEAKKVRLIVKANGSSFKVKISGTILNLEELDKEFKFLYSKDRKPLTMSSEIDVINSYFPWKEKYAINLEQFRVGKFKLPDSDSFTLEKDGAFPIEISANPSFQRQYHSLELVKLILLDYKKNGNTDWHLEKSLDIVMKWIERDYLTVSEDYKYAWYDHSVADRCIVFIELYSNIGTDLSKKDKSLLSDIIVSHLQLLASPVFYLRNQKYPYHNHGLFQDLALLISCSVLDFPGSAKLRKFAEKRMILQIKNLVSNEGVSVENSGGYHKGLERILSNILKRTENIIGEGNRKIIQSLARKMNKFMSEFFYPDGTSPAYGDTFNSNKSKAIKGREISVGHNSFPLSGYFSHRTKIKNIGLVQINLYNSSLSKIHKHFDNLQITFWVAGKEVFVDPGLSGYSEDDPATKSCRLAENHNLFYPSGYVCKFPNMKGNMTDIVGDWGNGVISSSDMFEGIETNRSVIIDNQEGIYRIIDWCNESVEGTFRLNLGDGVQVEEGADSVKIDIGAITVSVYCQTITGEKIIPRIVEGEVYFGHTDRRSCSAIEFYTKETPIVTTIVISSVDEPEQIISSYSEDKIMKIIDR